MRRLRPLLLAGALLPLAPSCAVRSLFTPATLPQGAREVRDLAYHQGPDFDDEKHRLNLFVPAGEGPHPVVVFAHGGGWFFGDRAEVGDPYTKLGRRLAARGILTVVISYRLAPGHPHPAHIEDVARAIAWTFANVEGFGGDAGRVNLMGHSAGGHLMTLAVTDPKWLGAHGLRPEQVAGVIALSAPLDVHHLGRSLPTSIALVRRAFGHDAAAWREVSPVNHLRGRTLPPIFVGWADGDFDPIRKQGARFVRLLRARGQPVEHRVAPFKGHFTVIMDLGEPGDLLGEEVAAFIHRSRS
jgi:acetyl esterase/lipase